MGIKLDWREDVETFPKQKPKLYSSQNWQQVCGWASSNRRITSFYYICGSYYLNISVMKFLHYNVYCMSMLKKFNNLVPWQKKCHHNFIATCGTFQCRRIHVSIVGSSVYSPVQIFQSHYRRERHILHYITDVSNISFMK